MKHTGPRVEITFPETLAGKYMAQVFANLLPAAEKDSAVENEDEGSDSGIEETGKEAGKETGKEAGKGNETPELVLHTPEKDIAECTRALMERLEGSAPKWMVFVSGTDVYGTDEGTDIDEEKPLRPNTTEGRERARMEEELRQWCHANGTTLTILRPATMFGTGMEGWAAEMFDDIMKGIYFHPREHNPRRSVVTAYDVARVARALYNRGGVFNVTDGHEPTMRQLGDAMGSNAWKQKRPGTLPLKWLQFMARAGNNIGILGRIIDSSKIEFRKRELTFDTSRLKEALPADFTFFDTCEVLARKDCGYPYEEQ